MTAAAVAVWMGAVSAVVHLTAVTHVHRWLNRMGLVRSNYAGCLVPTAGGVLVAGNALLTLGAGMLAARAAGMRFAWSTAVLVAAGSLAAAILGWIDDRSPDKEPKGFRGHFTVLIRERRLTSGCVKALGGGVTALLCSIGLSHTTADAALNAAILALSANAVNLFDLRPGRAIKVFAGAQGLLLMTAISAPGHVWLWTLPGLLAALLFFREDARGRMMLGDTGANFLGFQLGVAVTVGQPEGARWVILVLLVLLHVLAEKVSFSQVIDSVSWLRALDGWGRPYSTSSSSSRRMNRG